MNLLWTDCKRKSEMLVRLAVERRWRFAWFVLKRSVQGITSLHCKQCGELNWPSLTRICNACRCKNLMDAIFNPEYDEEEENDRNYQRNM